MINFTRIQMESHGWIIHVIGEETEEWDESSWGNSAMIIIFMPRMTVTREISETSVPTL